MKHLGNFVALLILAVNALFTGLLLFTAYSPHIQPVTHPVQSCLGLTFPVFLMINAGFLIFWLVIQRYRSALLPNRDVALLFADTHLSAHQLPYRPLTGNKYQTALLQHYGIWRCRQTRWQKPDIDLFEGKWRRYPLSAGIFHSTILKASFAKRRRAGTQGISIPPHQHSG